MVKLMNRAIRNICLLLLFVVPLFVCSTLTAGSLGDAAPELQVNEWIKEGPIRLEEGKGEKIYVIEFWLTECPHCLESLPYLSILQEQYKKNGVIFIGITVEDPATVRAFLKKNQDIEYAVAVDDEEKTYDSYMGAFGISGVPHTFVVGRQGRILWEGHPMDNLDEVLQRIVIGRYDLNEAINVSRGRKLLGVYKYLSIETDEEAISRQVGNRIVEYSENNAALLDKLARFIITNRNIRQPDFDLAYRAAKRACDVTGETDRAALEVYAGVLQRTGEAEKSRVYWKKAESLSSRDESEGTK